MFYFIKVKTLLIFCNILLHNSNFMSNIINIKRQLIRRLKMDYTKEELVKDAIRRLEALDDILNNCLEIINSACAERRLVRHLLFLGFEEIPGNN